MTWKTVNGERVLGPKEGALFFDFFDIWWDQYEGKDENPFTPDNAEPFASLSTAQKQTVVEEVLVHLLTDTHKVPELTAANESCIWSIFEYGMGLDIESMEEVYGEGILEALKELGHKVGSRGKAKRTTEKELGGEQSMQDDEESTDEEDEDGFWPYLGCDDEEKWRTGVECLADSILWDRDWELPHVQANPMLMALMRIDPGYFKKPRAKKGALARVQAFRSKRIAEEYAAMGEAGRFHFEE